MKLRTLALCLSAAGTLAIAGNAHAFSSGVSSGILGPSGCNAIGCHGSLPGTLPTVSLTGPTTVIEGDTNEYTFIITSPPGQPGGGLNVSSLLGDFLVGGADSAGTTLVPSGAGGNSDITHLGAKAGTGTDVTFTFLWTAPMSPGPATIDAWGNAVDGSGTAFGDGAAFASLAITVDPAPPAPVPGTSPLAQAGLVVLLLSIGALFVRRRSTWS